jgi:hypothetical protein
MLIVGPSRVAVGEAFELRVKLLGPVRPIASKAGFNTLKPRLHGPFNLNVERKIQYLDHALPEWAGTLTVDGGPGLDGPRTLVFDGKDQGVFPGDTRPIKTFGPFRWTTPGFHFLRLVEAASGLEAGANPAFVSAAPPAERLYWGDPHWQTFFSDGIRCPEELYAFARDEAFLDFGALSDHMEAVTDRQWDYFRSVTEDFNQPGRFATLHGQEWTHHDPARGAPGHRNVYFRGSEAPVLRSTDPACDTLEKLWRKLDAIGLPALAVPHHSANVVMGTAWEQGWNPRYEKAVEIYSVWGSSECPASAGNTRPIKSLKGEQAGRHVRDALRRGFRLGFMGGGDIHDGRPGDELHTRQPDCHGYADLYPQGFTAVSAPALGRGEVFDALSERRCYAATRRGLYADLERAGNRLAVRAAAEDGIAEAVLVVNGEPVSRVRPAGEPRILETVFSADLGPREFAYVRIDTRNGDMAWLSPMWRRIANSGEE